jgi:hypothetical protein
LVLDSFLSTDLTIMSVKIKRSFVSGKLAYY